MPTTNQTQVEFETMGDDYDLDGGMDIITKKNRGQFVKRYGVYWIVKAHTAVSELGTMDKVTLGQRLYDNMELCAAQDSHLDKDFRDEVMKQSFPYYGDPIISADNQEVLLPDELTQFDFQLDTNSKVWKKAVAIKARIKKWCVDAPKENEQPPSGVTDVTKWKYEVLSKKLFVKHTSKSIDEWTPNYSPGVEWAATKKLNCIANPKFCNAQSVDSPVDASDRSTGVTAVRHLSVNRVEQRKNRREFVKAHNKKRKSPHDFSKAAAAKKNAKFMQLNIINDSYLKRLKYTSKRDHTRRKRIHEMLDDIAQQMLACANQPED